MAKKYYNPIKENLYKTYGHKFSNREMFNEVWKQTRYNIVGKFGFGRTKEKLSQQIALIMREDLLQTKYGEKSLFYKIKDLNSASAQDIIKIEKEIYDERTEEFRKKYGDEVFYSKINEDGSKTDITLNDVYEDFLNDKITQEQMNEIIETIKQTSKEYNAQEKYDTKSMYVG